MIDKNNSFGLEDTALQPVLQRMLAKEMVTLNGDQYTPTDKGDKYLQSFYKKYDEYVKLYDVYCAVDLGQGIFAFDKFYDFDNDDDFKAYLNDDKSNDWADVRIAVCEYKKIDPIEIVFLSFMNEGRITTYDENWRNEIINYPEWNDIDLVCNNAIHVEDLMQDDVIVNVITKGSELMMKLLQIEKENNSNKSFDEEVTTVTETTEVVEQIDDDDIAYYGLYLGDPYYSSLCWQNYCWNDPYWW